jgi:hypothetical protein
MPTIDRLGDDPYLGLTVAERVVKYKEEGNKLLNKDTENAVLWYTVRARFAITSVNPL